MCKIVCYCSLANRFEALNNASRRARSRSAIGLEMIISARSPGDLSLTCSAHAETLMHSLCGPAQMKKMKNLTFVLSGLMI